MAKRKYVFGALEQAIMDVAWRLSTVTVRDVVDAIRGRQVAYTTVMTVMNRLVARQVLKRQLNASGAFMYRPRLSRETFCAKASRVAIDDIIRRYGAVAMAQFIDRLDRVPNDKLAELRRRLRSERKR
ncbi:MAG: BlaI/MecI/CopY family transcriptional regulator [Patescibacteria group bacterium]